MRNITYLLFIITIASCGASRHVSRETHTKDSTATQTTQVKTEDFNTVKSGQTVTVKDSSGQTVVFDTPGEIATHDTLEMDQDSVVTIIGSTIKPLRIKMQPRNTVKFKDGKIVEASGNIKSATTNNNQLKITVDTTSMGLRSIKDSFHTQTATVKTVEVVKEVEVKRKSWWWLWLTIGLVGGGYAVHLAHKKHII